MKLIISPNRARAVAAAIFLIFFVFTPVAMASSATVIRFPERSIGRFHIQRPAADVANDEIISKELEAVGTIKVPPGCALSLVLNYNGSQDTKFMRQLPATIILALTCKDLEIGDKAVADLCTQTELRILNLQGIDLTDEGVKSLSSLTKLVRLNISDTLVSEKGLAVLRTLSTVEHLNLSRLTLGDGVTERLQPLKNLRVLDLCGTQVKDKCIVGLQRFDNLHTLVLRRNNLTDKCIDSLRKIKGLAYLDVTDTLITFEGLKKLRGLPQLQSITIRRKLLKPGQYEQLKKLLHGVKIQDGSREKMVDPELFRPLH